MLSGRYRSLFSQANHLLSAQTKPNLFVRQGLTQTDAEEQKRIQTFMDWLAKKQVNLLFGDKAKSDHDFRKEFEVTMKQPFTPENFRKYRMHLLATQTDGMVFYWGKSLSVSGGFEVGSLVEIKKRTGKHIPLFFAEREPIKTTLLRDLPGAVYCRFENPEELEKPFLEYLAGVRIEMKKREEMRDQARHYNKPNY